MEMSFWETVAAQSLAPVAMGVIGYVYGRWSFRQRPVATITSFATSQRPATVVEPTQDFRANVAKFYRLEKVQAPKLRAATLQKMRERVVQWLVATKGFSDVLEASIGQLQNAKTLEEKVNAVKQLLAASGTKVVLGDALLRGDVEAPKPSQDLEFQLVPETRPENGGSLWIVFQDLQVSIAELVIAQPFRKKRLRDFVGLVCNLETEKLAELLKPCRAVFTDQASLARTILKESRAMLRLHDRWGAILSITNVGRSPIVLDSDDAKLVVESDSLKETVLECHLARHISRSEEQGLEDWSSIEGLLVIPPGNTMTLAGITRKGQSELGDLGRQLQAAFEGHSAKAFVRIRLVGPWYRRGSRYCKTRKVSFRQNFIAQEEDRIEEELTH